MKQKELETDSVVDKPKQAIPPPPPPLPLPRFWARKISSDSVTNREIAKFWRQKHADEEDHLLAPPPPPLPLPRFWARKISSESVTNREIAKFWRQKHADEEDHLLAAIKAAARKRARNLSEEDYKSFEESLSDEEYNTKQNITAPTNNSEVHGKYNEVRVGIKDWWTKSKYAYLNQPAVESTDNQRQRASTYIPNFLNYKPAPLYPTSLGVF